MAHPTYPVQSVCVCVFLEKNMILSPSFSSVHTIIAHATVVKTMDVRDFFR